MKVGNRLAITWYGVVQADFIYDTTRSYGDTIGSSLVAREDTYEGTVGRFQASSRATRFGMAVNANPIGGITPSAVIEADFSGDQPSSDVGASERSYYDSPSLRLRHGYLKLASDVLDVLVTRYCGLRHFGSLLGFVGSAGAIAGTIAPVGSGWIHDRTGSYDLVMIILIGLMVICMVATATMGRPDPSFRRPA